MQISEPLTESSIAVQLSSQESGLGKPLASLAGQMGCIYLFDDTLSPGKLVANVIRPFVQTAMPNGTSVYQGKGIVPSFCCRRNATALDVAANYGAQQTSRPG